MTVADRLRLPGRFDLHGSAYKDWFHVNLFDHWAGLVGLCNVSIHGHPDDSRSMAVGTLVLADLTGAVRARLAVSDLAETQVSATSVAIENLLTMSLDGDGAAIEVVGRLPDGSFIDLRCRAASGEIAAEAPEPFGSGWIAWRAVPRMAVEGSIDIDGVRRVLEGAVAYHDHNWGRWHWGDDAGWTWAALTGSDGTSIVLSHTTDRAHRTGSPTVHVVSRSMMRRFSGASVLLIREARFGGQLTRLPGAMAALHAGRMAPHLPGVVRIEADDGVDSVKAEFRPIHGLQLIAGDPVVPGYGFIHELAGTFTFESRLDGVSATGSGLGVFEHVD